MKVFVSLGPGLFARGELVCTDEVLVFFGRSEDESFFAEQPSHRAEEIVQRRIGAVLTARKHAVTEYSTNFPDAARGTHVANRALYFKDSSEPSMSLKQTEKQAEAEKKRNAPKQEEAPVVQDFIVEQRTAGDRRRKGSCFHTDVQNVTGLKAPAAALQSNAIGRASEPGQYGVTDDHMFRKHDKKQESGLKPSTHTAKQ